MAYGPPIRPILQRSIPYPTAQRPRGISKAYFAPTRLEQALHQKHHCSCLLTGAETSNEQISKLSLEGLEPREKTGLYIWILSKLAERISFEGALKTLKQLSDDSKQNSREIERTALRLGQIDLSAGSSMVPEVSTEEGEEMDETVMRLGHIDLDAGSPAPVHSQTGIPDICECCGHSWDDLHG
ncbi:hypothetical protein BJ508DRAFT_303535 [Ascobolus immersus RN42]|uniref:Uncharacterized protein n=1 Tax=Ascobolus immersus RN42 TaxID=1160509 RepID=A0A3N4IF71_ASCIM|nr:hypothetical protein BJ508DRAFT_303535 [Ascobolus immersus RN42]